VLVIGASLSLRLNSDKISQHFYQQLKNSTSAQLSAKHAELTFMHGLGLRLDGVNISHAQYQMQAKHLIISLKLLPLLIGRVQTDALDIHDANIIIKPETLAPTSTAISALPVQHIRLVRSRIQTASGKTVLDNLYLEMRNIGPDSETLWEMKAKQGDQALSGNGRLHFHAGHIVDGFSKLKMEHFQLVRLEPFAPHAIISWLEGESSLLSGTVTLDISKHQTWALFGEVELERPHKGGAHTGSSQMDTVLKLRGKLSHPAEGELIWRDSFIHLGKQAVIAIDGSCQQDTGCSTTLDAKQVPLAEWKPFMPAGIAFYEHMTGMTDLNASIQWSKLLWHGNISLQLTDTHFNHGDKEIPLPPLHLQADKLSGNATQWHTRATITSPQAEGSIQLRNTRHSNGDKDLYIDSQDADSALWLPLSNMLLSTLGFEPELQAVGKIHGKLHLHQQADKQSLSLDVDATQTQLSYASWLNKPAQIEAQCKARLDLSNAQITAVSVQQCRLDTSSVEKLNWSRRKALQKLSLSKLDLHIGQFKDLLPQHIRGLTGRLQGSGRTTWKNAESWLGNMSGRWQLEDVAMDTWQASGSIRVKNGIFSSHPLRIHGKYGKATLSGFFNPLRKRGDIDILSGHLDWNSMPALHHFWQPLSIQGRIYKARLKLLDNDWQNIQSYYTLSHGLLRLNRLKAELADGQFSSTQITFASMPDGIDIQGDIRTKNIQMRKLSRLHRWLGAAISGKLQANIKVHGRIGQQHFSDWQRSNGDILIYDGGWKQQQKPATMADKAAIAAPSLQSFAFSKLDFRFRIGKENTAISSLRLVHLQQPFQGTAMITSDLHLTGTMLNTADKTAYTIDSMLPKIHWLKQQSNTQSNSNP